MITNSEEGVMDKKQRLTAYLYHEYRLIAALPALCVIIDYVMTFFLAGDTSMILSWEASPFVRFAIINDIMIPYLLALVLFYYFASYAVLRLLTGPAYYKFGVLLIVTMSITHLLGGTSWYFRNAMYSNGVMVLSLLSIVIAFIVFGFSLIREHDTAHH
jgi:hypothetical protein